MTLERLSCAWIACTVALAPSARAEAETTSPPTSSPRPAAEAPGPAPAPEAEAEPPVPPNVAEARERVGRGEELFEQGNFDAALVEFQRAYDVIGEHANRYLVLFNIGQCHERRFRYDQALEYYRRYLEEGGGRAEDRERVLATIEALEGLLATVRIEVNVPVAELWVDERPLGTAPGVVRIPGGVHAIEVRAEGHLPTRREVSLPAGGEETVALVLERSRSRFEGLHHAYFWSAASLAAATLVAAAVVGAVAVTDHNALSGTLRDERDQWSVTQGEIDRVQGLALGADILMGAGAVLAAGSLILGLLTAWSPDERARSERRAGLPLRLGASAGGIALEGRM